MKIKPTQQTYIVDANRKRKKEIPIVLLFIIMIIIIIIIVKKASQQSDRMATVLDNRLIVPMAVGPQPPEVSAIMGKKAVSWALQSASVFR